MVNPKPKIIPYRRKRRGKTNYPKRIRLLLARKPRLVIRLTGRQLLAQLIEFQLSGDLVLLGINSSALQKYGWGFSFKNLPAAYLTGYLLGKKALQKKIKEAILDVGFRPPIKGSRLYACLKGAVDAGLKVPHSPEVFPSPERLSGRHIQDYAAKTKKDKELKIAELFQKTKQKIEQEK